jgi:hypothetical protein
MIGKGGFEALESFELVQFKTSSELPRIAEYAFSRSG